MHAKPLPGWEANFPAPAAPRTRASAIEQSEPPNTNAQATLDAPALQPWQIPTSGDCEEIQPTDANVEMFRRAHRDGLIDSDQPFERCIWKA